MTYDTWKTTPPVEYDEDEYDEAADLLDEIDRLTQIAKTDDQWAEIAALQAEYTAMLGRWINTPFRESE